MALLIDISNIPECACDSALEHLHKALNDEDGLAHDIWAEHESPFIRALIEKFTARGLSKIAKVNEELQKWIVGDYHVPSLKLTPVPVGYMGRWTQAELDLVNIYLQNIPPGAMTLDDWSMLIDYTVQRYLPVDQLNEEAEWLAVKSGMMGKVQAQMSNIDIATAATIVEALPSTVTEAVTMFNLPAAAEAIMEYGKLYGCENVQAVTESFRYKLKKVILNHESAKLLGDESSSPQSLEQALFDTFSSANRDWRRIALTEAGEMANQGVIASLPAGSKVRRMEMYRGACPFCKKIDGHIFTVVDPSAENKDGTKEVWVGKTNIGRSSSPRKRSGDELVERLPSELWWVAAGVMHPHCRGQWVTMDASVLGDDPGFASFLSNLFGHQEGMA